MVNFRKSLLFLLLIVGFLGCTTGSRMKIRMPSVSTNSGTLDDIAEDYYQAQTPQDMKTAVAEAKAIDEDSAVYHELAADLAYLNSDKDGRFEHLVGALLRADNKVAIIHIHELFNLSWNYEQTEIAEALLDELRRHHPKENVRDQAAHYYSLLLHRRGMVKESRQIRDGIGWRIPFAVIGTWDNEQGKGFDIEYPPEKEMDLNGVYPGQNVDVTWRTDLPVGMHGELDLHQLLYPNAWAVAYGAIAVRVSEPGSYELRMSTGDGMKVWINGELVFKERRLRSWTYDGVVIPIELNRGVNRILVKTVQETGGWDLVGRITRPSGAPVNSETLSVVRADTDYVQGAGAKSTVVDGAQIVNGIRKEFSPGSARGAYWSIAYAAKLGLDMLGAQIAEKMVQSYPNSLRGKFELTLSLWDNQERGRTSDLLASLREEAGNAFVLFELKQIRFWRQNDLNKKAREAALELSRKHPGNADVWLMLISVYGSEGWHEDACHAAEYVNDMWPNWPMALETLISCYNSMGFGLKENQIYAGMLAEFPYDYGLMNAMYNFEIEAKRYKKAEKWLVRMIDAWPERIGLLHRLGDLYRKMGLAEKAEKTWLKQKDVVPTAPSAYYSIASMAYYRKDTSKAVDFWREGLKRDPDNGALSERLAFLSPTDKEAWELDIPTETMLDEAVALRETLNFDKAADTALLMDHCVADLQADGSSINITSTVIHALNVSGRDSITEYYLPCSGYSRILHAYSVDPQGRRSEASSIRGKTIRFRQLDVGSTIVVQNRCEQAPDSLLGDYFSYTWAFQSFKKQFVDSNYILWAPNDTKINEFLRGKVARDEQLHGNSKRISWHASDVPVLKREIAMPNPIDVVWRLEVSTVPDWGLFLKWEDALLQDVFRESPEVVALANRLFEGLTDKKRILFKIQSYLASEIRYQQDYENYIAGVKPHTAPQVIARGYGDCKDKSVLFITLAKLAGIKAKFALVRTRGYGEIITDVPFQQFNHAIVYVPAQEGIDEARFFDPTADALDVDVLREDDSGTRSLVLNREDMTFDWIDIPFQDPSMNRGRETLDVAIGEDGNINGRLSLEFKGHLASVLRKMSRNSEQFNKTVQVIVNSIIKGGTAKPVSELNMDDINTPVSFSVDVESITFARISGKEMRFKIPLDAHPEKLFMLEKREHPLVLGTPNESSWQFSFTIPSGATIVQLPPVYELRSDCISFKREVVSKKNRIEVNQHLVYRCERISADVYPEYRNKIQKLHQALDEDVVVKLK